MVIAGPFPQEGQLTNVELDGVAIATLPGKYIVQEADRFGDKVSQGDLKYADFNPFESAASISNLTGGAGLRRYSDADIEDTVIRMYKEASGVNCSGTPIILAPQQVGETLTGSTSPPVWLGEFVPSSGALSGVRQWVVVAGTKVYRRDPSGSGAWLDTGIALSATPLRGAVGSFGGTLVFGYGSVATAQATTDLVNLVNVQQTAGPVNIFVWAFTSDRAAAFVAGGSANTNSNQVMSSTTAASGYTSAVICDSNDSAITSLVPGGGIAIVFVGKDRELGEIDTNGIYRKLIPFDSRWPSNCLPMRWWMASGEEAQRGAIILAFARENSLWEYEPSTTGSGNARNISPWANPIIRPPNSRGTITALQGTARWMYFTVTTKAGHSWVWRRDAATGSSHTYLDLGSVASQALGVTFTTSATGNPMLFVGSGNNLISVILPLDGDTELDDSSGNCRFTSSGYVDLADIDLGFPDEDKIGFTVHAVADDLVPGGQTIDIQVAVDNGIMQDLGALSSSPSGTVAFAGSTVAKRLSLRLYLTTTDPSKTPKVWAIVPRLNLNPTLYQLVIFQGRLAQGGTFLDLGEDLQNVKTSLTKLWADRRAGLPVPFKDRWQDTYTARILKLKEQETVHEPDKTPETQVDITLLLLSGPGTTSANAYDTPTLLYDVPTSIYGT